MFLKSNFGSTHKLLFSFILFTVFSNNIFAEVGCLVTSERAVYQDERSDFCDGSLFSGCFLFPRYRYSDTSPVITNCGWTPTSGSSCRVYIGSSNTFKSGVYGTFTRIPNANCPLDDYMFCLFIPIGILSFYYLRTNSVKTSI